jgi:hypothetical protein
METVFLLLENVSIRKINLVKLIVECIGCSIFDSSKQAVATMSILPAAEGTVCSCSLILVSNPSTDIWNKQPELSRIASLDYELQT